MNIKSLTIAAIGLALSVTPASASVIAQQDGASEPSARAAPSREDYPDAGQAFGMVWDYTDYSDVPTLNFHVPETDNQLWQMVCQKQKDGSVRIANTIIATPKELAAEDWFGFTVRVDNGQSIGVLARMLPFNLEGEDYHMPQFYLPNNHALLPALARGSRVYINLNGNKFSLHLKGSGDALKSFLRACQ